MWKGETNWPQHILTYNRPWASLSDCLCLWPANSLQWVPLLSSAPGSWDCAAQRWHCSGRFLFCVSRGLSEELWKKTTSYLHCCYHSGLRSQPNHEREGEESGRGSHTRPVCFPKASPLSRSHVLRLHFDLGDTLTDVLFISSSCEMGLIFLNCTIVLQNNIYLKISFCNQAGLTALLLIMQCWWQIII